MQDKIGSESFVNKTLRKNDLSAKKKFGQNFLTDSNILNSIVNAGDLNKDTAVIEIGPGLGALTELMCEKAGFVLAYEIDTDLIPILAENLARFDNIKVINKDILEVDINNDIDTYLKDYKEVYVIANLPYYITTPIILGLLSNTNKINKYVMMMQLEVADRICGKPSTKDYNALSVVIGYKAKASKVIKVPRTVFIPSPNVDSAVVKLDIYKELPIKAKDEEFFFKFIRECFSMRRKTLVNNLSGRFPKDFIVKMLEDNNIKVSVRSEELSINDFVMLSDYITDSNILKK